MARSSGIEKAAAISTLGGNWKSDQIWVVMVWKPAGSARMAGEPKSARAWSTDRMKPLTSAGATMRQRDGEGDGEPPGAQDGRRLLEVGGDEGQRVGDHDVDVGERVDRHHEDEARHAEDVDERRRPRR